MSRDLDQGLGAWPAWLDEDDFDGLGEEAWLAAREALTEAGPAPAGPLDDAFDDAPPYGEDEPVLGFGPGGVGEAMAPGASLGMLVEDAVMDGRLTKMSDFEIVGLIGAARRLRRRAEWLELRGTREFSRRRWEVSASRRRDENGRWPRANSDAEHAADELAFELKDSRGQAEDRMELSLALRDRLPCMDRLLAAGRIDERRVAGVRDITSGLDDAQARQVDQMLAPEAPDLPYTALRRRAAKLAISLDPESEARRKKRATRRRARVEKFLEASGNYALAARELPAEEALASEQYIRGLAGYLRAHGVKLGQREAELMCYLDLTQGRDPLDRVSVGHRQRSYASAGDSPGSTATASTATASTATASGGDATPARGCDEGASAGDDGPPDGASTATADGGTGPDEPEFQRGRWPEGEGPRDDADDDQGGGLDRNDSRPWPFGPPGPGRPGGRPPFAASINLIVPVGTAFGWSSMPGEAGRDVIDPRTLREMMRAASRHPATRWCVTLVGEDRTAVAHACARGRHTWDPPPDLDRAPGTTHSASPPAQPDAMSEGLAHGQPDPAAEFLASLRLTFEPIAKDTCDHQHAEPQYRASRKLRHLIQARDATCPAPGCGASSRYSDMDHTEPWPAGLTDECNIGAPCRHHHRTKQAPRWTLTQPEPGVFRWMTPSGRTHETRPTRYDS